MSTSVQASFEVGLGDFVRVQAWHWSRSWALRLLYFGWLAAAGLVVALRGPSVLLSPVLLVGTGGLLVGVPLFTVWNLRRGLRALKPEQLRKMYTFEPAHLVMADGLAETRIAWGAFERAIETSHAIHMFPQKSFDVQKTVQEQSRGATLIGLSKETEGGAVYYEAELKVNGHGKDILINASGAVVEVEEELTLADLNPAVRAEIQRSAGAAKILKVESVTKSSELTGYEIQVQQPGGKKSGIELGTDGRLKSNPKK